MRVQGADEFVREIEVKVDRIDGEVFRSQWKTADQGAAVAAELAPKGASGAPISERLADNIEPGTYAIEGGVRAVWGPTVKHGRHVEEGTVHMAPQPYLSPSLDRVAHDAERRLADDAGRLGR